MPRTHYFNTKRSADFSSLARSCIHPWYWLHLLQLQEQSGQMLLLCCTVPQHSRQHRAADTSWGSPCCAAVRGDANRISSLSLTSKQQPEKYLTSKSKKTQKNQHYFKKHILREIPPAQFRGTLSTKEQ